MTSHISIYRAAVLLYPKQFRREYGDDLVAAFAELASDLGPRRAWGRTLIDLMVTLPRYRLEALMNATHSNGALFGTIAATLLSLTWLGFVVGDLAGGPSETLRHWWSALPATVLALSVMATTATVYRRRRSTPAR